MAKWTVTNVALMVICSPCLLCGYLACVCLGPSGTDARQKRQQRQEARQRRKATVKGKAINVLLFVRDLPKYICGCILCCPCFVSELVERDPADKRRRARKKLEPVALPPRKRELSIGPGDGSEVKQLISKLPFGIRRKEPDLPLGEEASRILQLPFEIRLKIIEEFLGHSILHLVQLPKRLGHFRCWDTGSRHQDLARNCIYPPLEFYRGCRLPQNPVSEGCVALLQTCRQLYLESVKVLYETNTFDVNHAQTLNFLHRTILPKRLESIRYLQISWKGRIRYAFDGEIEDLYPDDSETWSTMWDIVGTKMTGLRSLKVFLWCIDRQPELVTEASTDKLLDGLRKKVRGLVYFGLDISRVDWADDLESKVRDIVCAPQ